MARTPKNIEVQDVTDKNVDQEKLAGAMAQMRADEGALALAQTQRESAVRAVAQQLGYQLPMEHIDPDLIQRDIAANMRRSVEACLEVGRGLRVLKEACEHGQFTMRLESLGIETRVAQRFMASASRFSNAASTPLLRAAGNQTKLFEMLVLDDDQVEELELTGQTGELSLDDVASMSVKELRAAVRKERQEAAKQKARAERQEAVNTELHEEVRLIKRLPAAEELKRTQREAADIQAEVLGLTQGNLRRALIALNNCEADQSLFMAGMVGQLISELAALRDEFNLPEVGGTPDWEKWASAQGADTAEGAKAKAN